MCIQSHIYFSTVQYTPPYGCYEIVWIEGKNDRRGGSIKYVHQTVTYARNRYLHTNTELPR
jgi:hypothetical protein